VFSSNNLAAGVKPTWTVSESGNEELWRVSCASTRFCAGSGFAGVTLIDPADGTSSTIPIADNPRPGGPFVYWLSGGMSCPSASLCLGVDGAGNAVVGIPPVDLSLVHARLLDAMVPPAKALRTSRLRAHNGYAVTFTAPSAGRLKISWTTAAPSRHRSHLIATSATTFADAATRTVRTRLTAYGRQLVKRRKHLRLNARSSFTPARQAAIKAATTLTLR
jgi:hypothetical protein